MGRAAHLVLGLALVVAVIRPSLAHAGECEAVEVSRFRTRFELEASRARAWRYAWAIGFAAAAVGQGTAAALVDDRFKRDTLWAGAIKAGIGATARLVLPVRIRVPAVDPDACADAAQLRVALAEARRAERLGFWLNHVGGFLVNAIGAVVVAHYTSWSTGALTFVLGYPIGLTSTYTMPRWAWHATPIDHGAAVGVSVAF